MASAVTAAVIAAALAVPVVALREILERRLRSNIRRHLPNTRRHKKVHFPEECSPADKAKSSEVQPAWYADEAAPPSYEKVSAWLGSSTPPPAYKDCTHPGGAPLNLLD